MIFLNKRYFLANKKSEYIFHMINHNDEISNETSTNHDNTSFKNSSVQIHSYKQGPGFWQGVQAGIPIALGYFAVSFTLGIEAHNDGMTAWQALLMSFAMHASAGEFAALRIIAASSGYFEMAVTSLIVNLRYLLLSSSLSQKLDPKMPFGHRFTMAYFMTDEIFGVSAAQPGYLNPSFLYGAAAIAAPGWELGTFLGASVGNILPGTISNALSVSLYGMFLAIILPPTKKDKFLGILVVLSMLCSYLMSVLPMVSHISEGFRIIILTVLIAGIAAWIKPVPEKED
jgi:predicted branched-subunit amino acid permease